MIASLPMYDWPEIKGFTDAWWAGLGRHCGMEFPLTRVPEYELLWRRDDLIFSQTCGYPLTHEFASRLQLIATPHYAVDGCTGPRYCSLILARDTPGSLRDLAGATAAINNLDSMSGMLALKLVFAPLAVQGRFFRGTVTTGGHIDSMRAIRSGEADVCAVDAVCVALARRYRPDYLDGLVEIARSPHVPALPFVSARTRAPGEVRRIREGLAAALADRDLEGACSALFLSGVSQLAVSDYQIIPELERAVEADGGLDLQ